MSNGAFIPHYIFSSVRKNQLELTLKPMVCHQFSATSDIYLPIFVEFTKNFHRFTYCIDGFFSLSLSHKHKHISQYLHKLFEYSH